MKSFIYRQLAKAISLSLLSSATLLSTSTQADESITELEVITINHQRHQYASLTDFASGKTTSPDLADWLASVPGANINRNGPVTGIAQFRGLYGDRIATTIDGHPIIGAGPNAMDTPLSYSTPLIVDSMRVYRGITPVSSGIDTLGGAVEVQIRKAETATTNRVKINGDLQAGYRSNNSAKTLSGVVNTSSNDWGLLTYGNVQKGDDMESGDSITIRPTEFQKRQFGADFRVKHNDGNSGISYHYTDTQDSGTPALPMDIEYIFSHRLSLDGELALGDWQTKWQFGYLDADHAMTNFLMRENNNHQKYRRNNADAQTIDFKLGASRNLLRGQFEIGLDGYIAEHDSVISNPNNAMFRVVNFNQVKDERFGLYGQWQGHISDSTLQVGARLKHARADAGEVFTSMAMMQMDMGAMSRELMDEFNSADRKVSDTKVDLALSISTPITKSLESYVGIGLKNRAPSYQERYLWMPMEATGGLADGNTYVGDINLNSEKAVQTDIGFTYQDDKLMVSPHVFYQRIDDYIQGTPMGMDDMTARMLAQMMSGDDNPLKFTNVDAKLYGVDIDMRYQLSSSWQLTSLVNYVKGKRRDIDDYLYRVAPLNAQLGINYHQGNLISAINVLGVASQNDVSVTNAELETAGYGLVNLEFQYFANNNLTFRGGVDNLFDREYQNHLGGYNRVKGSDIPVMERLSGEGLSAWAEMSYSF